MLPTAAQLEAMGRFNAELAGAGVRTIELGGLRPSAKGARIVWSGSDVPTVREGPFPVKDLVSGFWLLDVPSMSDAIAFMARAPFEPGNEIEIRPLFTEEDFAGIRD